MTKEIQAFGYLAYDAKTHDAGNNRTAINFLVAVNDRVRKPDNTFDETATFISCTFWRPADSLGILPRLTKGAHVHIRGNFKLKTYLKDKNDPTSIVPEVHVTADDVDVLTPKNAGKTQPQKQTEDETDFPFNADTSSGNW